MNILAMIHVYDLQSSPVEGVSWEDSLMAEFGGNSRRNKKKPTSNFMNYNLIQWSNQKLPKETTLDVVVCDNKCGSGFRSFVRQFIDEHQTENVKFHSIETDVPVTPFHMCNIAAKIFNKHKKYSHYVFNSNDCFLGNEHSLSSLLSCFAKDPNTAVLSPIVDFDNRPGWLGRDRFVPGNVDYEVNIGESVHIHFCIFDDKFWSKYDYKFVDILPSGGIENVLPFLAAAVGMKVKFCGHQQLRHLMVGCYGQGKWRVPQGFAGLQSMLTDGKKIGFGWPSEALLPVSHKKRKTLQHLYPIDFSYFKNNVYTGNALFDFLRRNAFLTFDTDGISYRVYSKGD